MWHRTVFEIPIILIFLLVSVSGSCLEYGHSCWGAHGKRSGGPLIGGSNDLNNAGISLRSNIVDNHAGTHEKTLFENLQDIEQTLEKADDNEFDTHAKPISQASKLRSLLRKHRPELMNRRAMRPESSLELSDPLNSNSPMTERWRKLPFVNMKKYAKHATSAIDANESEQQAEKKSLSRNDEDDGVYFDYK